MKTLQKIGRWIKKKNEFTFIALLIVAIWVYVPKMLRAFYPEAGEFSIEILYIPLIAGVYFFVALLFIWAYMALVWPSGYKMLDNIFNDNKALTEWEKLQVVLRLFGSLVALFAVSLLAVTGISAIMTTV